MDFTNTAEQSYTLLKKSQDPRVNAMRPKTKEKILTVALILILFSAVGILVQTVTNPTYLVLERPQIAQKFYVATKGGEAFEVNALHKCGGGNMQRAAIQATQNQTGPMNFRNVEKILVAVTKDYARINEGHIKEGTRCEITGITFKNITGKAYIVEETE